MLGEIKCAGAAGRLSRALLEESFEQRLEGGEEYAMRLSGGDGAQKRRMSKRKTPRRVYALPAQGQVKEQCVLGRVKERVTGDDVKW